MTIRMVCSSEKKVIFEVLNNTASISGHKEFIAVDLDVDCLCLRVKKELVADLLGYYAETGKETNWKELDMSIAEIMQSKVSVI